MAPGTLYGVGVGPGDPDLLTIKAARCLGSAGVVAYFAKRGGKGNARAIAESHINPAAQEVELAYPFTVEIPADGAEYAGGMAAFYDSAAAQLAGHLAAERDVAVLCEGDPLFYGSFMYLHDRLHRRFRSIVIPGITSIAGCAARVGQPLISTNEVFSVIPATLDEARLEAQLAQADGAAIIKIGRHLAKVRRVIDRLGLTARATYVERGTMAGEIVVPLAEKTDGEAIYFSLILVPGHKARGLPGSS